MALSSDQVVAQSEAPQPVQGGPAGADASLLVQPYLQLGHASAPGTLVLVWQTTDGEPAWVVEFKPGAGRRWQTAESPTSRRIAVAGIGPHLVWHTALTGLEAGQVFAYRLSKAGKVIFESEARAPDRSTSPIASSSSATAGPAHRNRRRLPIAPSCKSPIS